jgi:5-(carboxyamino)imidazole ribonucleotide mutase
MSVAIVLGSQSDKAVLDKIKTQMEQFEIDYEVKVISAHRLPDVLAKYAGNLHHRGFRVVIAVAGMSAALPGVLAAHTLLPVIGVPVGSGPLNGQDALHSIVQMPKGVRFR